MNEHEKGFENNEELKYSKEIADILRTYGDDYGFDEETCQEVAELPYGDAVELSYNLLTQIGFDAHTILFKYFDELE